MPGLYLRALERSGFLRTLLVFATVAVAGMALLPETPAHAGVGKDPATAYAPSPPSTAPQGSGPVKSFDVVAKRFGFEPATIEVTEGDRVKLVVTSADGVHGVGIRKFKVNTLVPRGGKPVTIEFTASAAGTFPLICSEACGDGHKDMRGSLVVIAKSK
jgi:cytochrome c oxidase subunit II